MRSWRRGSDLPNARGCRVGRAPVGAVVLLKAFSRLGYFPVLGQHIHQARPRLPSGTAPGARRRSATGPAGLVTGDLAAVGVQDLAGDIRRSSAAGDRWVARVLGEW